ncbi:MAG: hypothetical protein Q4F34_06060 [Prevotellaceae bacterium]|nr:hypothetical protein [Prevotellaceae bacterium]
MNIKKICFAASLMSVVMMLASSSASAQSGTSSPYSMYGIGVLSDQSTSFSRAMSGVAQGFSDGNQVNPMNPASYGNVDSLSFIFDVGMSLLNTNLKEGNTKLNAKSANFEYAAAAFRVWKNIGCSFGVLPYTNIGYNFFNSGKETGSVEDTYVNTYTGSGGLREAYLGFGWKPFKYVAFGFNAGYIWGDFSKSVTSVHSLTSASSLFRLYEGTVRTYKIDLGLQTYIPMNKDNQLSLGASYTIGHNMNNTVDVYDIKADTTSYHVKDAYFVPTTISAGLAWNYKNKLKVGADFTLYKFAGEAFPVLEDNGTKFTFAKRVGQLLDRKRFAFGADYVPDELSRNFFCRIHYRAGAYMATPYIKVSDNQGRFVDGPKELGLSFGFGVPIINTYNNRSILNVSGQWVRTSASNMITENYWRINIALTFNERWFAKWKFE